MSLKQVFFGALKKEQSSMIANGGIRELHYTRVSIRASPRRGL